MTELLTFEVEGDEGAIIVRARGEIDVLTAPSLGEIIESTATTNPRAVLILDLTGVTFLASAGLAMLARSSESLEGRARFIVIADGPVTVRPIELAGLNDAFEVFPTVEAALATV